MKLALDAILPTAAAIQPKGRIAMAKGQVRSNREAKKPKKEKPKEVAGAPSLLKAGTADKKK